MIPEFDHRGELPVGIHRATLDEVQARFAGNTPQRRLVTTRLVRIFDLARRTGKLERMIIFGSYVTATPDPNDVDIILVMRDDFREADYGDDVLPLLDHIRAQRELGASVFWTRTGAVLLETVDEFVAHWQITRDMRRRGIVEVVPEETK